MAEIEQPIKSSEARRILCLGVSAFSAIGHLKYMKSTFVSIKEEIYGPDGEYKPLTHGETPLRSLKTDSPELVTILKKLRGSGWLDQIEGTRIVLRNPAVKTKKAAVQSIKALGLPTRIFEYFSAAAYAENFHAFCTPADPCGLNWCPNS